MKEKNKKWEKIRKKEKIIVFTKKSQGKKFWVKTHKWKFGKIGINREKFEYSSNALPQDFYPWARKKDSRADSAMESLWYSYHRPTGSNPFGSKRPGNK